MSTMEEIQDIQKSKKAIRVIIEEAKALGIVKRQKNIGGL
jgi:hypothetical protein